MEAKLLSPSQKHNPKTDINFRPYQNENCDIHLVALVIELNFVESLRI
jgi:hypothetical protein